MGDNNKVYKGMMMNSIKVYVHGRPQGQDIWCAEEDSIDYHYLKPFLDSRLGGGCSCGNDN